ncbi:fimbrial biogenesis chaperone [Diaphorobacter caeni]|uniref:fimbrial biogenesis chaperone n=1 Tax=Diaphorobacter caeni TaxID=2784387 RepID=UPI00188F8C2C|nr:fimbria/pilus periplasmic chaperone [Diaphorobacter caeni]MBF5004656.1 molecular chaperone [Diaphorobacter caeni]
MFRRRLHGCIALICAGLMTAGSAMASGSLQVSNVLLELQQADTSQGLWLTNEGATPLRAQSRLFQWTQDSSGADQLTATAALTASPPILEIAPGERQFVRVVRLQKGDAQSEQTFRLLVSELPPAARADASGDANASRGVQLLIQHSIPVFVIPQDGQTLAARHRLTSLQPYASTLSAGTDADASTLQIQNTGRQRVRISKVDFVDANGKTTSLTPGLLGYVLAGHSMKWRLPLPHTLRQSGGRIDARLNDDTQSQTLVQIPAGK